MKIISIFPALILSLSFLCCNSNSNEVKHYAVNVKNINNIVQKALSGDAASNQVLSYIMDSSFPVKDDYNKIRVDSVISNNQIFYFVLIENPNPAYNRFAVYDQEINLLLMDKSLNGELDFGTLEFDGTLYGRIVESFLSRDIIIKRLSLYKFEDALVRLAFRTYTYFNSPNLLLTQEIGTFSKDTVITTMTIPKKIKEIASRDTFVYKPDDNMFLSSNNTFTELVFNQLKNNSKNSGLPEITDEKSLRSSLGIEK